MATVYKQILVFCIERKLPMFELQKRVEIGRLINEAYRISPNWKFIGKVAKKEPEGTFNVWRYPDEFKWEMNKIIASFYANNSISGNVPRFPLPISAPEKPKRKRILKPQYSASPVNNKV